MSNQHTLQCCYSRLCFNTKVVVLSIFGELIEIGLFAYILFLHFVACIRSLLLLFGLGRVRLSV